MLKRVTARDAYGYALKYRDATSLRFTAIGGVIADVLIDSRGIVFFLCLYGIELLRYLVS